MKIAETLKALSAQVTQWKQAGLKVGFVPTMGNLHQGHLSLVQQAQSLCDRVVVSVFVNPMQFGPNEDFEHYPRTFQADSAKLNDLKVDLLYLPSVDEMYPNGLEQTRVVVPDALTTLLEGASRPGHFDGVSTVVCKLFNMVQPDVALFGQKDYQQWLVILRMVQELALPVEVVASPIVRDKDGLALSSRNKYLSSAQRAIAPKLNVILQEVAMAIVSGNQNFKALEKTASQRLLQAGFDDVDYVRVCDPNTLQPAMSKQEQYVILAVARLGETRLLDNTLVRVVPSFEGGLERS